MTETASIAGTAARPLEGIRVVDLTRLAPSPCATMRLADLGAEVVVVGGGSGSLPIPASARGKRFVTLDLKAEAGREALLGLVRASDVLVEGYRPGVMERLGLGWEARHSVDPRLIVCDDWVELFYGRDAACRRSSIRTRRSPIRTTGPAIPVSPGSRCPWCRSCRGAPNSSLDRCRGAAPPGSAGRRSETMRHGRSGR